MDFYEVVRARRSIRAYTAEPVPDDALERILTAAQLAPSACNKQPWRLYVVRDADTRRQLFSPDRMAWAGDAPVVLVACSEPQNAWVRGDDRKNHADVDIAIFMEHVVLAATAEGLGTCWLCAFDPARFRRVLELPAELEPVAATPLGFPAQEPPARPRKALDDIITWR